MNWIDFSYASCSWLFALALWPTVRNRWAYVPRQGSGLTAILMAQLTVTHAYAGMWNGVAGSTVTTLLWAFIWWKRGIRRTKADRNSDIIEELKRRKT